jgi:hypothetical protein
MNRNYDGCKRVFIISKPVNGKRKQTLKQNFYLLCLHIHVHKIIELQMSHLTSKDLTNTLMKLWYHVWNGISVHNIINVSKVI